MFLADVFCITRLKENFWRFVLQRGTGKGRREGREGIQYTARAHLIGEGWGGDLTSSDLPVTDFEN